MKFIIALLLVMGTALAETSETQPVFEDIEVGAPRDCVVVGKTNDQAIADELTQIQQKITDCLAPQEEQAEAQPEKNPEIVSQ